MISFVFRCRIFLVSLPDDLDDLLFSLAPGFWLPLMSSISRWLWWDFKSVPIIFVSKLRAHPRARIQIRPTSFKTCSTTPARLYPTCTSRRVACSFRKNRKLICLSSQRVGHDHIAIAPQPPRPRREERTESVLEVDNPVWRYAGGGGIEHVDQNGGK